MEQTDAVDETRAPRDSVPTVLEVIAAFVVIAFVNLLVQTKTAGFTDPDGYYHIRWSQLLGEGFAHGRLTHFVWLPLTLLNERDYADQHFFFHVFQIPFAWKDDLVLGAKVSAVVFASLAYLSCYALVAAARVRYRFVWVVLLLGSSLIVLARMSLPRAPAVMLIILVAATWLLFTRRYVWLAPLGFLAAWTYGLFPLVGVFAVLWAVASWIDERRVEWQPVAAAAIGLGAGLVTHPYFPKLIYFLWTQARLVSTPMEAEGNEWRHIDATGLFVLSWVALLAQTVGTGLCLARFRRCDARTIMLALVSLMFFALTVRSIRFADFWTPFAVVFLAYAAKPAIDEWWDAPDRLAGARRAASAAAVVLVGVVVAYLAAFVMSSDAGAVRSAHPEVYETPAKWLETNTPEGALVYNVTWEDFSPLFCFNPHNTYVSGLSPSYLNYAHPELQELYQAIEAGEVPDPAAVIRDKFGARYVFVSTTSREFLETASKDPRFKLGFRGQYAMVLVIGDDPPDVGRSP